MAAYYGIITRDKGSTEYGIHFPDLACYTNAETLEELEARAKESLKVYLEESKASGAAIPAPSEFKKIQAEAKTTVGFVGVTLITVPEAPELVRVNISLAASDLSMIDAARKALKYTRSRFIVAAAIAAAKGDCELR